MKEKIKNTFGPLTFILMGISLILIIFMMAYLLTHYNFEKNKECELKNIVEWGNK